MSAAPEAPPFATYIDLLELVYVGLQPNAVAAVESLLPRIQSFRDAEVQQLSAVLDILDMLGPEEVFAPLTRVVISELQEGRAANGMAVCSLSESLTRRREEELAALAEEDARLRSQHGGLGVDPGRVTAVEEALWWAREVQNAMRMARMAYV